MFIVILGMISTPTLLIGYYYGLLIKSIDADLLTDTMCSVGLLTASEVVVISSGHSPHHRNCLLLEHVRHMDVQDVVTFCELVEETWPQVGSQLTTGRYLVIHKCNCLYSYVFFVAK